MPAPLDLTGRVLGRLTVLRRSGRMKFGRVHQAWLCRCECGSELRVPQDRLPHRASIPHAHVIDACRRCRAKPCVICGHPVTRNLAAVTCSRRCATQHTRQRQLAYWHSRYSTDPDYRERKLAVHKRARRDPTRRGHVITMERKRWRRKAKRMRSDPKYRDRVRAQQAATYQRHREEVQRRRRARLDAMTPEQRQAWCERMRTYSRNWRRKWRADLHADPKRHQEYLDLMREYRRQRDLLALLSIADALLDRRDQ